MTGSAYDSSVLAEEAGVTEAGVEPDVEVEVDVAVEVAVVDAPVAGVGSPVTSVGKPELDELVPEELAVAAGSA